MSNVIPRPPILSVRHSLTVPIGIVLVHRLLMEVTVNDLALRAGINDVFITILTLGIAMGMFYVARCSKDTWRILVAWRLLGAGILLVGWGQLSVKVEECDDPIS